MPILLPDIRPVDLSLPEKFTDFRLTQREVLDFCLTGPTGDPGDLRRFMCVGAPAGIGKSLISHALGKVSGMRYAVLTATRSLEDQQVSDGFDCTNIRGRANYECAEYDPLHQETRWNCEEGRDEKECKYADTALCTYGARLEEAKRAYGLITNYSYWQHARSRNRGALEKVTTPIELLICDEAHKICSETSRVLSTWISHNDLFRFAGEATRDAIREGRGAEWGRVGSKWIDTLLAVWSGAAGRMGDLAAGYETEAGARRGSREYRKLERLCDSLDRICTLADVDADRKEQVAEGGGNGNWIWIDSQRGVKFECIWPARYAERYLWTGVKRIVLMSATLRPKALTLCGVPKKDYWFNEWGRVFPAENCPVYHLPSGVRMRHGASEAETDRMVEHVDAILGERLDRKCIIHTGSYPRAEWLQSKSKFGRLMILNKRGTGEAQVAADKFREADAPRMLVGPSYVTGWDFPNRDCEVILFVKMPFGDRSDPVVQARMESDPDWYSYECAQDLQQGCFRGQRHEGDKAEVFILDDAIGRFMNYAKDGFSRWFRVKKIDRIPPAPERMAA